MEVTKLHLNGNEYNLTDADAQSKISEIKENTYNKEFIDLAFSDVDESLKDYAKSSDVAANYLPKGNYLTLHQSLTNYYTKSEVDKAIEAIPSYDDTRISNRITSLEAIDHTQYLTTHLDISNLATKAEVKTVSDKVNALKVPTKVSELTNDSQYQTESLVSSAIKKVVGAAPEALDTLEEIADKLKDNDDVVAGLISSISSKADKSALNSYYNKTEVDNKIAAIDFTPYETKEGAASKYQPIGNYLKEHLDISGKVDKISGKGLSTYDYSETDRTTVNALRKINSLSHIEDDEVFSHNANEVKFNYNCVSTTQINNPSNHSVAIPIASAISAGIVTAKDKTKLDATPTFWIGTQAQYDALVTKDSTTLYLITDLYDKAQ